MVKQISVQDLGKFVSDGACLVDVREVDEISDGTIGDCNEHWPLSTFGLRQQDISRSRPTIFYCRSGIRSLKAAEIAESWTDQELYILQGGYLSYRRAMEADSK